MQKTVKKIKSLQDIEQLREQLLGVLHQQKARVLICSTGCRALGADDVVAKFKERLKGHRLEKDVAVVPTGCIGICALAPVVLIEPYNYVYGGVSADDVADHASFCDSEGLVFPLLSDPGGAVSQRYGSWIAPFSQRHTFLIDPKGVLRARWVAVRPQGHSREVLDELSRLQA